MNPFDDVDIEDDEDGLDVDVHELIRGSTRIDDSVRSYLLGRIGKMIGAGADGEVYEMLALRASGFEDEYARCLKICMMRRGYSRLEEELYPKLVGEEYTGLVRLFSWGRLDDRFAYVEMERLVGLNRREQVNFHEMVLRGRRRRYVDDGGLSPMERLERKMYEWECKGFRHGDLHTGNVMRDLCNWKLIDLDGFLYV